MSQNVLITGASGNLGSITCRMAVEAGYNVIGTYNNKISGGHDEVEYFQVDLSSNHKTSDFITSLHNSHQKLYAAMLLAGGFAMSNISNTSTDDLMDMYEINFLTAFNIIKPVYNWMKETGGGRIVIIGAKPALEGAANEVIPYALAKGSLIQLAGILNESGRSDNIVVSVVVPGIIDTHANRIAMPEANFKDWITPEDIAGNILHLISKEGKSLRNPILKLYGKV